METRSANMSRIYAFNIVAYALLCSIFVLQPVMSTNQNQEILLERVNSQLEIIKLKLEAITSEIELLQYKTNESACHSENHNKLLNDLVDEVKLIKNNQNNITNVFDDLKENFNVKENETSAPESKQTEEKDDEDSNNNNGSIMDTLNEVLIKQKSLEAVFQLILESSEKNSTAEFIKNQFDDLKTFLKTEKSRGNYNDNNNNVKQLHDKNLNCLLNCNNTRETFVSCNPASHMYALNEGFRLITIANSALKPFYAYCTIEYNSPWMIIQRREDGSQNFYRNWQDYKSGFGDVFGEYWIGLERLHAITQNTPHELLIYMRGYCQHQKYAKYSKFKIGNEEDGYRLTLEGFVGNDSNALRYHNGMKFSTYDRDNDMSWANCARRYKGAWWYNSCYQSNLNGRYFSLSDSHTPFGINWNDMNRSLQYVYMAIRPIK